METDEKTSPEEVLKAVVGALKKSPQVWEIKGAIATNIKRLVILDLGGGTRGARAIQRAEDIAKANGWKLAITAATWLRQHNRREFYQGKPRGLQLTIVSEVAPTEGVDRKYVVKGTEVAPRTIKIFEWKRVPGIDREWFVQDNVRRYDSKIGPTIHRPWASWVNSKNCHDCGMGGRTSTSDAKPRPMKI